MADLRGFCCVFSDMVSQHFDTSPLFFILLCYIHLLPIFALCFIYDFLWSANLVAKKHIAIWSVFRGYMGMKLLAWTPKMYLELGVCCSCLRSVDCKISIRCSMSAFLLAFNLCIYLKVFACSWGFLSICFVLGGFGDLEMFLQKCIRFLSKIMPKSIRIHWKSIPNRQNWSPGTLRKCSWKQVSN